MRRFVAWCVFAFALLSPGAALAEAGYVHDLTGKATVVRPNGSIGTLRVGDIVAAGSTVRTEEASSLVLKFEDGQVAALSANTQFRVIEYKYNKANVAQSSAAFNLLQGGLRFITGVIGSTNRSALRLNAGTATIGIRGTDLVLLRDAVTQAVTAAVNTGAVTLTIGAVFGIGLSPGQAAVSNRGESPVVTALANLAATQFGVVAALNTRPNLPINTPVVVAASARAAAAAALANLPGATAAAKAEATKLLNDAIQAAQQALTQAIQAGAVPPTPGATPQQIQQQQQQLQQQLQIEQLAPTGAGTSNTGTTNTGTPTGGAGGGGGGGGGTTGTTGTTTTNQPASPN